MCGGSDNFDIFTLSAPGREILIVVETQTLPVHYFGAFHLTEENCASNESAAQIVSSISFDLHLLSFFFFFCSASYNFDTPPDTAKLTGPRSSTDEKVGGPVENMGGPIKLLYVIMFNILKSCQKWIFGPVKHEKFSRCLSHPG